jgi:hypothetical protein
MKKARRSRESIAVTADETPHGRDGRLLVHPTSTIVEMAGLVSAVFVSLHRAGRVPRRDAAEVDASCVFHSYCDLTVVDRSLNYRRLSEMSRSFPQAWVAVSSCLDSETRRPRSGGAWRCRSRLPAAEAILAELGDGPVAEMPQLRDAWAGEIS